MPSLVYCYVISAYFVPVASTLIVVLSAVGRVWYAVAYTRGTGARIVPFLFCTMTIQTLGAFLTALALKHLGFQLPRPFIPDAFSA